MTIEEFVNTNNLDFSKTLVSEHKNYDVYKVIIQYNKKTIIIPDFCNGKSLPDLSIKAVLQSLVDDYNLKKICPNYTEYYSCRGFDGTEDFDTKEDYENLCHIVNQTIDMFGEDLLSSFEN